MKGLILGLIISLVISQSALAQVLLTDSNRTNIPTSNNGGWGPHLRSIFKDNQGDLWYADDLAIDITTNTGVRYHKLRATSGSKRWLHVEHRNFNITDPESEDYIIKQVNDFDSFGRIQQNTAHISNGTYIYSYGIDVERKSLMECYFHTSIVRNDGTHYQSCNKLGNNIDPLTNYVGAAISPSGKRIVWWTSVSPVGNTSAGKFFYRYHNGTSWSQTVTSPIVIDGTNYPSFSYVHMTFKDEQRVEFVGQVYNMRSSANIPHVFSAASGSINIASNSSTNSGHGLADFKLLDLGVSNSSRDIWYNPSDGSYHALAYKSATGRLRYYYKLSDNDNWQYVTEFIGINQGRFNNTGAGCHANNPEKLNLVLGGTKGSLSGIRTLSIDQANIAGAINWDSASNPFVTENIPLLPSNGALDAPSAIFIQSSNYQTTCVNFTFAAVGLSNTDASGLPTYGHNVWFFSE